MALSEPAPNLLEFSASTHWGTCPLKPVLLWEAGRLWFVLTLPLRTSETAPTWIRGTLAPLSKWATLLRVKRSLHSLGLLVLTKLTGNFIYYILCA